MNEKDRLLALVPRPNEVRPFRLWAAVEGRLNMRLPLDYKWLVDTYGAGSFDDFLYVLVPESQFPAIRLEDEVVRARVSLESLRRSPGSDMPFAESELLPVAKTDNGDCVYWVTRPEVDPDSWTIAVLGGGRVRWSEYAGGIVAFLVSVLSAEYRVPYFPEDLPSGQIAFEPAPEVSDVHRLR